MRICSGPGCLRAVQDDVRFCDECKPTTAADNDSIREHGNRYDAEIRAVERGSRWQAIRASVIRRDPLCRRCQIALSVIADHIVPAQVAIQQARESGKYSDPFAGYYFKSNLQGLCRPCHGKKTLEDKAHVGPWPDVVTVELAAPKKVWTF